MAVCLSPEECCGCGACAKSCPVKCIEMASDKEGFLYPHIRQEKCIQCGACERSCPGLTSAVEQRSKKKPVAYAVINPNDEIRLASSSGGMFTLLAEAILSEGGIVFGAAFTVDFHAVEHIGVENAEGLARLRGSKYLQSRIGDAYQQAQQWLDKGRKVLFSGTPCQIEGLKSYLCREYDHLFTLDIICHGVPSPSVWEKYVDYREACAGATTRRMFFRHKKYGWKTYATSFEFSNDVAYEQKFSDDPFMRAFLQNVCLRPSCYTCKFKKLNRVSDITLADFWGIERMDPAMDDDKGTSLVIVHSSKGQRVFEALEPFVIHKQVDILGAIEANSAMTSSVEPNKNRAAFFEHIDELSFDKLVMRYARPRKTNKDIIKRLVKKLGFWDLIQRMRNKIQ